MKRVALILTMGFLGLGASQCAHKVALDQSAFAIEANDATVVIEGCGSQPVVGYTYCRFREGAPTTGFLSLLAPNADCNADSCVSFQVFFPAGTPALGISVPKGQNRAKLLLKDLVKRDTFQKDDRGFWPVLMSVKFMGSDGNEHEMRAEGEIRMRVLAAKYTPLQEVENDPNYVWQWSEGKTVFKMTTAGRAWVSQK